MLKDYLQHPKYRHRIIGVVTVFVGFPIFFYLSFLAYRWVGETVTSWILACYMSFMVATHIVSASSSKYNREYYEAYAASMICRNKDVALLYYVVCIGIGIGMLIAGWWVAALLQLGMVLITYFDIRIALKQQATKNDPFHDHPDFQ